MEFTALFLSRLQFAFTVSFHIIYPSFTIGLAAWLCVLQALYLKTTLEVYDRLFNFWLKIFGIAFGLGVVSGVVMAFQFGSNWSRLSELSGPIQGPLLSYESFTAFAIEASFFGVLIFGRPRVSAGNYLLSTVMVALGTTMSAFWIMVNNSWMQHPVGFELQNGVYAPTDWGRIIFSPVVWVRFPHMLLAAYITGAFCVAATGAWYRRYRRFDTESRVMLRMGLWLAAALVPMQLFVGHLTGDYVHEWQPAKFAAIEARWHDEQPAAEVLIAWPDSAHERNRAELRVPYLGSLIASMTLDSKEVGLTRFPKDQRPPVLIPFLAFRIMVGCGLLMLAVAWLGSFIVRRETMPFRPWMLRGILLSFPLPFIATLTGWFTAEVGRQPWTVYEVLRTADAVSPHLKATSALGSLIMFTLVYALIFAFGTRFIYRQLKVGPMSPQLIPPVSAKRPLALGAATPNE
jgi:cytochrome d ubiquinol oxidase subunit I